MAAPSKRKNVKAKNRRKSIVAERNKRKGRKKTIMKCPFCVDRALPVEAKNVQDHLIVIRDVTGHFHVHGPIKNKELMKEFILRIGEESGIDIEDED